MVLESTMVCVDDSDFMRNGDFVPTRMAAMQDAVQVVCNAKTRANPENNVGLLTLASSEVLSTLTTDPNKLISKLLAVQPEGELKLMSGLRVAHLALKHRQGKNHKMRIIVFIGSPIDGLDANELVRLAKKFKKEKVNVDIVSFGDGDQALLQKFIDTLNGEDGSNSRLVVVPPGPNLTSAIMGSPILMSEDGIHMAGAGGGNYDFGIDPNDDPELALALRVSMEEQRARQEAENRNTAAEAGTESGATHEDQMLEQALAMSMAPGTAASGTSSSGASARPSAPAPVDLSAMTEEQQIAYALQMSMQDTSYAPTPSEETSSSSDNVKMEVEDNAASTSEAAGIAASGNTDSGDVEMADVEQAGGVVKTEPPESSEVQDTAFLEQILEDLPDQSGAVKKEPEEAAKEKTSKSSAAGSASRTASSKSGGSSGASKKSSGSSAASEKKKPDPKKNTGGSAGTSSASSSTNTKRPTGSSTSADKKKAPEPPKKKK